MIKDWGEMQKETSFKHSKDKTCLSYGGPAVFFFKIETYPSVRLDENLLKWTKDNAAKAFSSLKQSWMRLSLTKATLSARCVKIFNFLFFYRRGKIFFACWAFLKITCYFQRGFNYGLLYLFANAHRWLCSLDHKMQSCLVFIHDRI